MLDSFHNNTHDNPRSHGLNSIRPSYVWPTDGCNQVDMGNQGTMFPQTSQIEPIFSLYLPDAEILESPFTDSLFELDVSVCEFAICSRKQMPVIMSRVSVYIGLENVSPFDLWLGIDFKVRIRFISKVVVDVLPVVIFFVIVQLFLLLFLSLLSLPSLLFLLTLLC